MPAGHAAPVPYNVTAEPGAAGFTNEFTLPSWLSAAAYTPFVVKMPIDCVNGGWNVSCRSPS